MSFVRDFGRKFAIYSLHLPGFAHHKKQTTSSEAWEGSKHKNLAEHIKAEDDNVGGDFNEWTDGIVMQSLSKDAKLENTTKEKSIDHILLSTTGWRQTHRVQKRLGSKKPERYKSQS